jgi:sugar lactone lactonase YvrE
LFLCDRLAVYRLDGAKPTPIAAVEGARCAIAWDPRRDNLLVLGDGSGRWVDRNGVETGRLPGEHEDLLSDLPGTAVVDGAGRLVVADSSNGVFRVADDGAHELLFDSEGATGLAIAADGSFAVGDLAGVSLVSGDAQGEAMR